MKKIAAMLLAGGLAMSSAQAGLQVQWEGLDGFVHTDMSTIFPSATFGDGQYLAQLIWTPDNFIADAWIGGAVDPGSNEVIIDSASILNPGDVYGPLPAQNYAGLFVGGYIYARVFDVGSDNPANITVGSAYYAGPLVLAVDNADPGVNQVYNIHQSTADAMFPGQGFDGFGTDVLNQQVVPEPTVLALAALGLGVVAVRRFRRS
ncbi:MAG: PEP-CTERM sorting domain-containing protein [Kiritimatiellae bacterium]|nr:PEP-CTERM sorting domain-containing protein [Kiritimatiellia bacterium]